MGANLSYAQQPVLATVPLTKSQVVIPTYLGQVPSQNSQVVATLASQEAVVARVMPEYRSQLEARQDARRIKLELEVEALSTKVSVLGSGLGRAELFLNYAWNTGTVGSSLHNFRSVIAERASTGASLASKDLTPIVEAVYTVLRRAHGATSAYKEKIRQYISSGEADEEMLKLFAAAFEKVKINNVFRDFLDYLKLRGELQQAQSEHRTGSQLEELEKAFTHAVVAIKSGTASPPATEVGGLKIDVYQMLQQRIGASPEKPFLCDLERLVEAQNNGGLIVPFGFKAAEGASGVPEGIRPNYRSIVRFGQIITLFDRVLDKAVLVYSRRSEEVQALGRAMISKTGKGPDTDLLMRGILEENGATLALYPDERVLVPKAEDLSRKTVEIVRQSIPEARRIAAEYFGVPEEEFRLEELARMQSQIMQVLPLPLYVCASIRSRAGEPMQEVKKRRARLSPKWIMLLSRYETNERRLQKEFNVTLEQLLKLGKATEDEAINLFGEEFNFVRQVLAKDVT